LLVSEAVSGQAPSALSVSTSPSALLSVVESSAPVASNTRAVDSSHQAALLALGRAALVEDDVETVLRGAVSAVAAALTVPFVGVLIE
jgi:hypothetical protein